MYRPADAAQPRRASAGPAAGARLRAALGSLLLLLLFDTGAALAADPPLRVVYHLDDHSRAIAAFRNLENHRRASPGVEIVVVALGQGVDFLLQGARDERGNPYEPMIDDQLLAGTAFRVCRNTLQARGIEASKLHPEVTVVDSGVAEITRLQLLQGHAYLKP